MRDINMSNNSGSSIVITHLVSVRVQGHAEVLPHGLVLRGAKLLVWVCLQDDKPGRDLVCEQVAEALHVRYAHSASHSTQARLTRSYELCLGGGQFLCRPPESARRHRD